MLVRSLRPIDVVALASFQRLACAPEITAHNWPRVEPESHKVPYLNMVSASLAHRPGGQRAWVARQDGRLVGLAVARSRAGRLVSGVVNLHAGPEQDMVAAELLDHVAAWAGSHASRRVFL